MFITLQQHKFSSENIKGTLGIEPGAAGCEALTYVLCSFLFCLSVCLFICYPWQDGWTNCVKTQRECGHLVGLGSEI